LGKGMAWSLAVEAGGCLWLVVIKIKPHKNGSNSWGCVMAAAGETADWAIGLNGVKQQKLQNLTKLALNTW
jgi:hypothetical protein